ncbi:hypothetical protein EG328_009018 [Venturia inaequalis]|uniref:3'-5' exonuclease n=1 Tax=Venturia inaequalis TaxID=5025 RepID=A0A8H3UA51_VENIN|nr:hypothetical protein EG328_009018 [Venturia inaequalis]
MANPTQEEIRALRSKFFDRTTKPKSFSALMTESSDAKLANLTLANTSPVRGGKSPEVDQDGLPYFSHADCRAPSGEALRLHYCPTFESASHALKYAVGKTKVGLDCEWGVDPYTVADRLELLSKETPKSHMDLLKDCLSVILLSTDEDIFVIHLARFNTEGFNLAQLVPNILATILNSEGIVKVGAEVKGDADLIEQWLDIKVRGLRCAYRIQRILDGFPSGSEARFGGLAGMTKKLLGKAVKDKDENGQRSPWHLRQPLTERQSQYAANDAIIPLRMDDVLCNLMEKAGLDINISVQLETSDLTPSVPSSLPDAKTLRKLDSLEPNAQALFYKLRDRRNLIIKYRKIAPVNIFHVADTTSLINLAKRQPTTSEEMSTMTGVGKGARHEYLYDFVNVIQKHLNVQVEPKPENWKDDAKVRRLAQSAKKKHAV